MIGPLNMHMNAHAEAKLQKIETLKAEREDARGNAFARIISTLQSAVAEKSEANRVEVNAEAFRVFLDEIGYTGKPIASLSKEEAAELVSDEGFFGVTQTSERIARFVITGARSDEGLLRKGREGVLQGLKEAETLWGGKLPEIAYETVDKALEMIDKALVDAGYAVLDTKA